MSKGFPSCLESIPKTSKASKTLIFVPPASWTRELALAFQEIDCHLGPDTRILTTSNVKAGEIAKIAEANGLSLENRFDSFPTVEPTLDESLYPEGLRIGEAFFDILQSIQNAGWILPEYALPAYLKRPFAVAVLDRIVSVCRPLLHIAQCVQDQTVDRVIYLPPPTALGVAGLNVLRTLCPNLPIHVLTTHLSKARQQKYRELTYQGPSSAQNDYVVLPIPAVCSDPVEGQILFCTRSKPLLYRRTTFPVISALLPSASIAVVDASTNSAPNLAQEFGLESFLSSGQLRLFRITAAAARETVTTETQKGMALAIRRLHVYISGHQGTLNGFGPLITQYFSINALPLARMISRFHRIVEPHVRAASRVVTVPGRLIEAGIMMQLARKFGVPSLELQSGVVNRNQRYIAPLVDYALVIDSDAEHTYSDFMKFPRDRIEVIGSPKLDHDLEAMYRGTQAEVRQRHTSLEHLSERDFLIVFASQPIGNRNAGTVLSLLLEGLHLSGQKAIVLVKPHPAEGEDYLETYRTIAVNYGCEIIVDQIISAVEAVVASDLVVTYYSTVGVEAHALKRPVIAANPFRRPLPYNLCALAAAREATSVAEMAQLIDSIIVKKSQENKSVPDLLRLQLGQAKERAATFILSKHLSVRNV